MSPIGFQIPMQKFTSMDPDPEDALSMGSADDEDETPRTEQETPMASILMTPTVRHASLAPTAIDPTVFTTKSASMAPKPMVPTTRKAIQGRDQLVPMTKTASEAKKPRGSRVMDSGMVMQAPTAMQNQRGVATGGTLPTAFEQATTSQYANDRVGMAMTPNVRSPYKRSKPPANIRLEDDLWHEYDVSREATPDNEENAEHGLSHHARSVLNQMARDMLCMQRELRALQAERQVRQPLSHEHDRAMLQRVTPKDVPLEPFSGSKDPNGLTIDREFFLPLLHWLKGSVMQLRASQLPEQYWVSTLLSALRGAAKKAFTRIYGDEPIHTWSVEKFHVSIAQLVPDHETQFTETALDMVFHAKSLGDDIAQFAMLLRNGDREVGLNTRFVFKRLQDKIRTAVPSALREAQDRYQLRLEFQHDFDVHISTAQTIAAKLHADGLLDQGSGHTTTMGRKHPRPDGPSDNAAKKKFKLGASTGFSQQSQTKPLKAYVDLAKRYNRCFGCGYYVEAKSREEHKVNCRRNASTFNRRMGQIKKQLDENPSADPNEQYRGGQRDTNKVARK
jgi:hypothetical protein